MIVKLKTARPRLAQAYLAIILFTLAAIGAGNTLADPINTHLESAVQRMISYRHQEHSWITPDGGLHVLINEGVNVGPNDSALALFSSYDRGHNWTRAVDFGFTNDYATSDGYFDGEVLHVAYHTAGGRVIYRALAYDTSTKSWSLGPARMVFSHDEIQGSNPSVAVDASGRPWVAYVMQTQSGSTTPSQLKVAYLATGKFWRTLDQRFGSINFDSSPDMSGRLIQTANGVGMVYTNGKKMFWASRANSDVAEAQWSSEQIFEHLADSNDLYASHFSVLRDQFDNIHLAFVEDHVLQYQRLDADDQLWSETQAFPTPGEAGYMQLSELGSEIFLMVNSGSDVQVLVSEDEGLTFAEHSLLSPPAGSSGYPRIEAPAQALDYLPLLQQFGALGQTQQLYLYEVQ